MKSATEETIRIAVDARPLSHPVTGVARVIYQILKNARWSETQLIKEQAQNKKQKIKKIEYHLFSNRPLHEDFSDLIEEPGIVFRQQGGLLSRKAGLWFNLALPFTIRRESFDLFWGSQQVIPPFLPQLKIVLTFYDLVLYFFPAVMRPLARMQQRLFQSYSIKKADYIFTISETTRKDVIDTFHYPAEKIEAALLGYHKPQAESLPSDWKPIIKRPYFLSVSTIEPRKNYSTLMEAYLKYVSEFQIAESNSKKRNEQKEPAALILAGRKGWESKEFYDRLAEIQAKTGSLYIAEGFSDGQLRTLYENCSAFLFPSLYEGFGLPLLEAMLYKKPAVSSDIGTSREIGVDDILYADPLSIDDWVSKIKSIHESLFSPGQKSSKKKGLMISEKCIRRLETNLNWQNTSYRHVQYFRNSLQ